MNPKVTRKQIAQLLTDAGLVDDFRTSAKYNEVEFWGNPQLTTKELRQAAKWRLQNLAAQRGFSITFHKRDNLFYINELPEMPGLEEMLVAITHITSFAAEIDNEDVEVIQRRAIPATGVPAEIEGHFSYGYFLPIDPNVQYLEPVTIEQEPLITIQQATWMCRDGQYAISWGVNQVLAVYGNRDETQYTALLYCPFRSKGYWLCEFEADQQFRIEQNENPDGISYDLRRGFWGDGDWEVNADVRPDLKQYSAIRVYFEQGRETTMDWYSTNAPLTDSAQFYAAYGKALDIARQLDRDLAVEAGEQE